MVFYNIKYIYFLIFSIFLFVILYKGLKRKNNILEKLLLKKKKKIYVFFLVLGYTLGILALTGPRKLSDTEKVDIKGADIYVLIDTSKSMTVEDVEPSRMEKAKYEIRKIIEGLKGDRISFIPFTDSAYVQMPLTDDYDMAFMYLDAIDTDLINSGGTDFENVLDLVEKSYEKEDNSQKIILIVSDGENHKKVKVNEDLIIYTIGIGTSKGGVIPSGHGFIKDDNGNVVISTLESGILKKLAKRGKYYESNNLNSAYDKFLKSIENIKRKSSREEEIKRYKEYYQYLLSAAFIMILIVCYMEERE